jgi:hypothetical protein
VDISLPRPARALPLARLRAMDELTAWLNSVQFAAFSELTPFPSG